MFQTSDVPAALQRDATDGVQSVHVDVEDPAEIDSLFDAAIVYAKGARMLVMARALVGDDALRKGLKNYFAAHKFHNATGDDLWSALGEASGMDVGAIMKTWLDQPGYPVVTAKLADGQVTLTQNQFFIGDGQDAGRKWSIPLNSNYAEVPELMTDKTITVADYDKLRAAHGTPFLLNVGNNSHFIVQYDQTLMKDILQNVDQLDAISQLQILQDLRLLADGKKTSYATFAPLLPRFANSHGNVVNAALYRAANKLKQFVTPKSAEEKQLKAFFDQLSSQQLARLGWTPKAGEANDDQLTRPYILSAALYAENAAAIKDAHQLFTDNADNLGGLSADIRVFVLRNEVKNFGSAELFYNLLNAYRQTADASYKADISAALTSTTDPQLIAKLVEKFEDADTIKPQDLRAWFRGVLANDDGQQAAWDWIRNDWQWLEDTVGGDMEFATYITVIASVFKTSNRLAEFKAFFEPKLPTPGLTREIKMDISVIESRVNLINEEKDAVNAAIAKAVQK
ncbi:membrane alanyl aminopeptidase domain protein [Lentilactobacillus parafarraginis F0439]|uniref:Membrane alanyl aminopeptidase domain protein n=1 Tax=Lentilactobacillus parafarraginis F0439 TaxID=797515 RepID=G9ZTH3_9LACO|nr:membrane alanyl aminopeptidase domain protein [Lentilactobacillus parafarraginis F0439]